MPTETRCWKLAIDTGHFFFISVLYLLHCHGKQNVIHGPSIISFPSGEPNLPYSLYLSMAVKFRHAAGFLNSQSVVGGPASSWCSPFAEWTSLHNPYPPIITISYFLCRPASTKRNTPGHRHISETPQSASRYRYTSGHIVVVALDAESRTLGLRWTHPGCKHTGKGLPSPRPRSVQHFPAV